MISSSIMIIYARKYLRDYDAFDVGSVRLFATAMAMMPFALLTTGFDSERGGLRPASPACSTPP